MQVYAGFECHYDGCDEFRQLHKLFKDELDALRWVEQVPDTGYDWRVYQPIELE